MTALDWNAIAQISAARIVDCLVEGTLIALFAGLVARLARRQNSSTRFAIWFSALLAIALLPLLSAVWSARAAASATGIASHPAITLPSSLALYLCAAWLLIAAGALARVGVGMLHLRALRQSCVSVDPDSLDVAVRATLSREQAARPVDLCVSDEVHVPTAIGFTDPAVVIPSWLMKELSPEELNQVVLHELAHLRRWDDWTNLAQKIVKAVFFFHPAVWWIERQVALEREMACDDAVLAETASPRAYAQCLARLAEVSFVRRASALAQAAVGRIRQTSLRVAQILDGNRSSGTKHIWKPAVAMVAAFGMVCAGGLSRMPRLVAFQDNLPVSAAARATLRPSTSMPLGAISGPVSPTMAAAHPAVWKLPIRPDRQVAARVRKPAVRLPRANDAASMEKAFFIEKTILHPAAEDLVHAATWQASSASTEAVFVVVESRVGSGGQALYQISVWKVTLTQPDHNSSSNTVPRKT